MWKNVYNCLPSQGSGLCSAGFHGVGRYPGRETVAASQSSLPPLCPSSDGPSPLCDGPHRGPAWLPFQGSWSGTTNAPAALRGALSPRLELPTPVTVRDNRSVSSVCQKIVSICIFGNGDVCLINLYVTATQRAL